MKKPIQPYLHFDENCRAAMEHYQSLFGGHLELMTIGESPAKDEFPKEIHHEILHANLRNGEFYLMASDMCGSGERKLGNHFQLSLNCDNKEEIQSLYKKLSEGGTVLQELGEVFWGGLFAMVIDKFGIKWMLSLDVNQD